MICMIAEDRKKREKRNFFCFLLKSYLLFWNRMCFCWHV